MAKNRKNKVPDSILTLLDSHQEFRSNLAPTVKKKSSKLKLSNTGIPEPGQDSNHEKSAKHEEISANTDTKSQVSNHKDSTEPKKPLVAEIIPASGADKAPERLEVAKNKTDDEAVLARYHQSQNIKRDTQQNAEQSIKLSDDPSIGDAQQNTTSNIKSTDGTSIEYTRRENSDENKSSTEAKDKSQGEKITPKTALAARAELRPRPMTKIGINTPNEDTNQASKRQTIQKANLDSKKKSDAKTDLTSDSPRNNDNRSEKLSTGPNLLNHPSSTKTDHATAHNAGVMDFSRRRKHRNNKRQSSEITLAELPKVEHLSEAEARQKNAQMAEHARKLPSLSSQQAMPVFLRVLCSCLLLIGMSILFTWFIIWRQNLCDLESTQEFISEKPNLFTYSYLVIFLIMAVAATLTWRVFVTIGLSFTVISIITFIHMQKFAVRAAPLVPEDFLMTDQAGNIADFVDVWSIVRLIVGVIFIMIGAILLENYAYKVIGRDKTELVWWDRIALVPRITLFTASMAALVLVTEPILAHDSPNWIDGLELVGWNQTENYKKNGFVIGFLYNLGRISLDPPDDYNEDTMRKIANRYRAIKIADDSDPKTTRKPLNEVADNIIVILDETFYDPELLSKYYSHRGGDPLPNLRRIFRKYPSGYMYSPEYGGGTANVEFEVQTGLSNYWANSMPYVNSIPKTDGVLGIASWAKDFGFQTTAIHTYDGTMYKRNLVYPLIGYDHFIDRDAMSHNEGEYSSGYINDRSIFLEVLDILKESDEPKLVAAVTMQNHAPYDAAQYPELSYSLIDADNALLEASFQSLHFADQYLGEFLDALDQLEEKTVVLWFGDHAAGVLDAYTESEEKVDLDTAHLTPYFIYANFDIESEYSVEEVAKRNKLYGFEFPTILARDVDLPVVTPNCLQNTLYDILNVEKPALFYLVDEVCEEMPILSLVYLGDTVLEATTALHDYELVNYDILGGEQYWDGE